MENPDDMKTGTDQGAGADEDKAAKAKPAKVAKTETVAAETAKPARAGRVCKETVRWKKKTYAPGEPLPANVPAEIIDRLEELGFV
ncbi:MAG: hypothetical protein M9955_13450 [Rhizobiaceae bacterium]|nr:hypothetical protein [Rhizobiaceae bacterium]